MKTLIKILPVLFIIACSSPESNENIAQLTAKRDSLQNEQFKIQKQLNQITMQIAIADTSVNPHDIKILKQITMQKNKIVGVEKKITLLENKMTAKEDKKLLPVAVKEMQNEQFDHYIISYGEVEAKDYAMISPEMNGRIEKIHISRGDRVSKGKLLVSLNAEALDKQTEGVVSSLDFASETFEKQDNLWKQGIGSEIEYLTSKNTKETLESQLESLKAQKRMAQIRAPFNGIVDKIFPKEGEMAGPAFPVIEFVNLENLIIKADVSETHIDKIKKGQIVKLSFSSLPDFSVKTPISEVSNVINSASRTFEIEMQLKNPGERIKPNMVSSILINDFSTKKAFVLPSLVIRKDFTGDFVYIITEKENRKIVGKKYVETGLSYNENTTITSGLNAGDKVIIKGFHLVSTGLPVNVVE
ncbi:MAG: efflux RND transporter periplasmic adaptor subunit [Bacteroidales bacterium]|nr:efflux RND transporter periplasmic adaptor subunit [Bacteroidales bacterium]